VVGHLEAGPKKVRTAPKAIRARQACRPISIDVLTHALLEERRCANIAIP
jgi:hypothetical protein